MTQIGTNQKSALTVEMKGTIGAINSVSSFVNKLYYYEKIPFAFLYFHLLYFHVIQLTHANLHNIVIYK